MKKSQISALRGKSPADLQAEILSLREQLFKTRIAGAMEGKQRGMQYRATRRQIARIETILTQKKVVAP